jgi:PAS domain-containing protein
LRSPEAQRLFGYSAAEALGQYAADLLIDSRRRSRVLDLFGRALSGESWADGFPIRCKDGTVATLAEAGMRIGTSLDLERTAHELADIAVDDLADVAAVDVLVIFTAADPAVPDRGQGTALSPLAVAARPPADGRRPERSIVALAAEFDDECELLGGPPADRARLRPVRARL